MDAIENVLFLFIKIILIRFEFLPNYNEGNFSTIDIVQKKTFPHP